MKFAMAFALCTVCCGLPLSALEAQSVWAIDRVAVKPGQQRDYIEYLRLNWMAVRTEMQRRGVIRSFDILTSSDSTKQSEVLLLTEYADSANHANREAAYQSIVRDIRPAGAGPRLVNGKTARDMTDSIMTSVLRSARPGG